jgi:hypothetical protein
MNDPVYSRSFLTSQWVWLAERLSKEGRTLWQTLMLFRISLGLIGLGVMVLLLPQGQDIVRGLIDDANVYLKSDDYASPDAIFVWLHWAFFILACLWCGITAWYWSTLLYRIPRDEIPWIKTLFMYLARALALAPMFAGLFCLVRIALEIGFGNTWIAIVLFGLYFLALVFFVLRAGRLKAWLAHRIRPGSFNQRSEVMNWLLSRFGSDPDPHLTRADDAFFLNSLFWGTLLGVSLMIPGISAWLSWTLGAPALTFLAISFLIAGLSVFAWLAQRLRFPVLAFLLLTFVLCSYFNDNHEVRRLKEGQDAPTATVAEALARWDRATPSGPLILVAAAGGASRAGYWTGTVMRALDDKTGGAFAKHVFAISAVSGGSLGAVGFAAWTADHSGPECRYDAQARATFDRAFLGMDYLSPTIGGLLFPDLLQRFIAFPMLTDRAQSLEDSWEVGWRSAAGREGTAEGCRTVTGSDRLAQDYQSIWRASLAGSGPWVPLVLVNGTLVENGKRIITAPIKIDASTFPDSYDFFAVRPGPIRASTAILNGARFPVVSPAGTLRRDGDVVGRIIDGGYFENGGLETLTDLLRMIRATPVGQRRRIIVIEIDNNIPVNLEADTRSDENRYANVASLNLQSDLGVDSPDEKIGLGLSEITSIVGGLYKTRGSRGVLAAKRLSAIDAQGFGPDTSRLTFNLPRLSASGVAMSWALSLESRDLMDDVLQPTKLASQGVSRTRIEAAEAEIGQNPDVRCERRAVDEVATAIDGKPRTQGTACALRIDVRQTFPDKKPREFSLFPAQRVGVPLRAFKPSPAAKPPAPTAPSRNSPKSPAIANRPPGSREEIK